jgi:hypothetical protein
MDTAARKTASSPPVNSPIKFGTSGWRGIIAEDFTFGNVRVAVAAIAQHVLSLNPKPTLLVARDRRFFSEEFARTAAIVLTAHWVHPLVCSEATPTPTVAEHYSGKIQKFGVDIGYVSTAVIVWGVIAPTSDMAPGALAGTYVGATGSASVGVGVGANVLVGGFNKSVTLQPVSLEGNQGLNVAGGIGAIRLRFEH